jgi:Bacterial regulatory protein, Fis family
MTTSPNKLKRNAMMLVAALAVIAGVIVVASSDSHHVSASHVDAAEHGARERTGGSLALAASYLGISRAQLRRALRADGTLAAVANATAGKSQAGLIEALLSHSEAALRNASVSGAQAEIKLSGRRAKLRERITAEVNRPVHVKGSDGGDLALAARYLGVTRRQLRSEQRTGRSLAQIAAGTGAKSTSGLIAALVDARRAQLSAQAAAGAISKSQQSALESRLRQEVSAEVERKPGAKLRASATPEAARAQPSQ